MADFGNKAWSVPGIGTSHEQLLMSENPGGFRTHHKYMIAAIGVLAVLAFLYNLGIFDIWSVDQIAK